LMTPSIILVVCLIALVEGMDLALIGASQQAFFQDVEGWDLWVAGRLALAGAIPQSAGAAFWGIIADRGVMKRRNILCFAAALQALCTFSLACVSTVPPMWPIRMANGIFLAALRPISNGIVADLASAKDHGYYFGLMQGFFAVGGTATGMIVGPLAESTFDIPLFGPTRGWRLAFAVVSCVAIAASVFSFLKMPDVPAAPMSEEEKQQGVCAMISSEVQAMIRFLKYPSFVLMICQGIFGTVPFAVYGNLNLYARLCGFEQWTLFWLGLPGILGIASGFLGGNLSDRLNKMIGPRGRPLTAMMSVACTIPLKYTLWYGILPGSYFNNVWTFVAIEALWNFTGHWPQPGCNFPILGQIVTGKQRNKVMCWEMALENTMANIIGNLAVPIIVRELGGEIDYQGPDLEQARVLGTAAALVICIPNLICFGVYSGLLWSFPLDLKRVQEETERDNTELAAIS